LDNGGFSVCNGRAKFAQEDVIEAQRRSRGTAVHLVESNNCGIVLRINDDTDVTLRHTSLNAYVKSNMEAGEPSVLYLQS
jgi:hypothetical protein